jgi:mannose-6-phosphate isomerase-like protein (cupin superfamily)
VGFNHADPGELEFVERESTDGPNRYVADLTPELDLKQSRARLWRYPPRSRGRRHADKAQEEVFVCVSGTLTMVLGEPGERVDVSAGGVVAVDPGTPLQVFNDSDSDLVFFAYGAPPEQAGADFFDDAPLA